MEQDLFINACGFGTPPSGKWYLARETEVQRLYYIRDGSGQYTSGNGQMRDFQSGWLYLFPYNLRDHFVSNRENPISHLYFDFLSAPPVIAPEPICVDTAAVPELRQAVLLAQQIVEKAPGMHFSEEPLRTQLLQLILTLMGRVHPIPYSADETVCQALATIQTQYGQKLTVTRLAQEAGFEESYFIRHFRTVMGQTPYTYLRNYRLMQARRLLSTGMSPAQAAEQVGYETTASLARALRNSRN